MLLVLGSPDLGERRLRGRLRGLRQRIQDIRSINLTTSGLSGLVGIGRLEFSSAASDDADVIFWNTPSAEKIRDLVRSLQTPAT